MGIGVALENKQFDDGDSYLVALALNDPREFRRLYQLYADRLYWYALSRTRSATIADDIVSDTVLTALERLDQFDASRGAFSSWIFAIASRKIADHYRYHQRFRRFLSRLPAPRTADDDTRQALELLLHDEEMATVYQAMESLSTDDQNLIALRYGGGLTTAELSNLLGITQNAVRMRLSRATRRLGEQLPAKGA